jgi:alanine racemase
MNLDNQTIWVEVNLGAIRRNIQRIGKLTGRPVMAVVKANAYGHGLIEVSKTAVKAGAAWLCVARVEEAIRLREAGIEIPLLVMGYTTPERIADAIKYHISLMVNNYDLATAFDQAAKEAGDKVAVHAKIDTGMGRLGVYYEEADEFGQHIANLENLDFEGIFTHFACADEPQKPITNLQIRRFDRVLAALKSIGVHPKMVHAANSAGCIFFPDARYDAVRPGIAIFGMHPSPLALLPGDFEPALSWKCRLTSVKTLPPGFGISYGHKYYTKTVEKIAATSIGYADGLRRLMGNVALVDGHRVQQAGTICMDQSMWRLPDDSMAKAGDEMVLIGKQGDETITAEELGALWGTINYEVVCGLMDRVPRFYLDE